MIHASPDDVLLANSTTYTLNLVAQGLTWQDGDEVICVAGDFPATVLPWVALEDRGVRVTLLRAPDARVDAERLTEAIGPRTRVVCLSWVSAKAMELFREIREFGLIKISVGE